MKWHRGSVIACNARESIGWTSPFSVNSHPSAKCINCITPCSAVEVFIALLLNCIFILAILSCLIHFFQRRNSGQSLSFHLENHASACSNNHLLTLALHQNNNWVYFVSNVSLPTDAGSFSIWCWSEDILHTKDSVRGAYRKDARASNWIGVPSNHKYQICFLRTIIVARYNYSNAFHPAPSSL